MKLRKLTKSKFYDHFCGVEVLMYPDFNMIIWGYMEGEHHCTCRAVLQ